MLLTKFLALVYLTCAPMFLEQNLLVSQSKMLVKPDSSFTTGKFSPFQTLPKASAVHFHWTGHDSYLSFSQKSSCWQFIALAKLRSTTQAWNHQKISNSWIKVDCRLSDDSFLAHALLQGNSAALPCYKYFAAGFPTYPCHMAFIPCLMTAFFTLCSRAIVQTFLTTMLCSGIFNMRKVVLFKVLLLLRKVVCFRNFLSTWFPCRPSLVGADTSTKLGRFQAPNTREPKKRNSWVRAHRTLPLLEPLSCLPWSFSLLFFFLSPSCGDRPAILGPFLFFLTSPYCGDRPAFLGLFLFLTFSRPLFLWW